MDIKLDFVSIFGLTAVCRECYRKYQLSDKITESILSDDPITCDFPGCDNTAFRFLDVSRLTAERREKNVTIDLVPTSPREMSIWI